VPLFSADPIGKSAAPVNGVFSGTLSGNASDPNGQPLTFSKISGPSWLSIAASGTLSGTPQLADLGLNRWTVQVSSSGGTDTAILLIDVTAPGPNPPSGLSYSSPPVYTKGTVINNLSPSTSGGGVVRYAVTPKLPSGLSMNSITGLISGTPLAPTPAVPYTITATNPDGSTTTSLNITVIDIAPSALTYSSDPATYRIDQAITLNAPTNSGGAVVFYAVSPALPAGLSLNTNTGIISGTPTALSTSANYTITATNTGGSTTAQLSIAVEEGGYRNTAFITINDNAAASPYPSAIVVPTTAGTITKVTATIYGLTHDRQNDLDILLVGPLGQKVLLMSDVGGGASVANVNLTFDDAAGVFLPTGAVPITTGTYKPTEGGAASDTFSAAAPAAPYGLTLSVFNGSNPEGTWSLYVMDDRAINTGSISGGWRLSLQTTAPPVAAPSALSYSSNPATYTKDTAITINTPTSSGGAVVSYSVSPALPAGLTLTTSTGIISGTPTALTAASNYTITATNTGGSTDAWVNITVVSPYAAWSAQYGLLQALEGDDDGDGNSNYFEFVAGLVPTNAGSVFKTSVSSVPGQPNQRAIVFSPIISGRTYTVKSSESLQPATWIQLSGSTSSDNGNERTVIDTTATEAKKFYVIEIHYQ
jgi:subtilisin-like proprotein convertase family protein